MIWIADDEAHIDLGCRRYNHRNQLIMAGNDGLAGYPNPTEELRVAVSEHWLISLRKRTY
jgi:hypothetical protein